MPEVTQAEYARHRKRLGLPGGTKQNVGKAVKTGRITLTARGLVDVEQADRDWLANTQQSTPDPAQRTVVSTPPSSEASGEDYAAARARAEKARATLAELKVRTASGALVDRATIERMLFEASRRTRDLILAVPKRVAAELALEGDATAVQRRLEEVLVDALEGIVPEALQAGGG